MPATRKMLSHFHHLSLENSLVCLAVAESTRIYSGINPPAMFEPSDAKDRARNEYLSTGIRGRPAGQRTPG